MPVKNNEHLNFMIYFYITHRLHTDVLLFWKRWCKLCIKFYSQIDEKKIRETISEYLSAKGINVTVAENGKDALDYTLCEDFDLIILDVMMPVLDGIGACREIRKRFKTPVLFLSALGTEQDLLKGYTSGAAHELKTPLTVITNQCECIIENISPEKNDDYINSIYTEALRMNKLVATLLQYNKVNSISSVKKEKTDMQIIAETEIDKYSWHFEEKNFDLQVNLAEAAINCNDELIALVVDNFLSNAVKHTKEGGIVKVSLEKERKHVKFSVFNEGEHISSVDAKHIWEEFYKKDKARSRNDNSTGMGLAVCKRILSLHGFKYGYKNVKGGVEFYFIAPSK